MNKISDKVLINTPTRNQGCKFVTKNLTALVMIFQAQHSAAAKAALEAALKLAEEAKTAAKEAESVAAAKQYHAAHLSSKQQNPRKYN